MKQKVISEKICSTNIHSDINTLLAEGWNVKQMCSSQSGDSCYVIVTFVLERAD